MQTQKQQLFSASRSYQCHQNCEWFLTFFINSFNFSIFTTKCWFIIAFMMMLCLVDGCRDRESMGPASEKLWETGLQPFLNSVSSVFPSSAGLHFCNRLPNCIAQICDFVLACLHIVVFQMAVSLL